MRWTRAIGLTMAAALVMTGSRLAVAGGEEDLAEAKRLIQEAATSGKLSKKTNVEILKRLEERGLFSSDKGTEVRSEVVAYLSKVRVSKLVQNEPAPVPSVGPAPERDSLTAINGIGLLRPLGSDSVSLSPADGPTVYRNENGGIFNSGALPRTVLEDVNLTAALGFPPTELVSIEFGFVVTVVQPLAITVSFWDGFDPAVSPVNSNLLGSVEIDFGIPPGTGAFTSGLIVLPTPIKPTDSNIAIQFDYRVGPGGPLGTGTVLFAGGGADVGVAVDRYYRDVNANTQFDSTEALSFGGAPNLANFYMHLRGAAPTAETEPNDSLATATNTACSLTLTGSTDPAGDIDYYRFSLATASLVTAEVLCGGGDSTMTLRDSGGASIEFDDDDGPGLCSIITRVLTAGTYYLEIHEFGDNAVMPYSIALTCSLLDESEPNDSQGTADATTCGTTKSALIEPVGDTDYWTFTLANSSFITATLNSGAGDSTLSLQDGGGELIFADNFGGGTPEVIQTTLGAGTYYLEARDFGDDGTFSYSIALACQTIDETEPNDSAATASAIACNQVLGGVLSPAGDFDYWTFTLTEQTAIDAEVLCGSGDSLLFLYDGAETLLASSDDEGPGLCSIISTLLPTGTYYLEVRDFGDNSVMPYSLSLQCTEVPVVDEVEPNDDAANANAIACGQDLRGIVSSAPDLDYWVNTEIVALSLVSVRVDTPTSSLDPVLFILDAAENVIAVNDDANGLDSQVDILLSAGTYYFVVGGFSGTGGTATYTITVTCQAPTFDDEGCISNGQTVAAGIDVAGEIDSFGYTAAAGETLRLIAKSGSVDVKITVIDPSGVVVDRDDDDADVADAQALFTLASAGSYTVAVQAGLGETGGYTLFADFIRTVTVTESEPNDSLVQGDDISHLARAQGEISSPGDVDLFRFFAGVNDVITVRNITSRGNDNTPNAATDLLLRVLDGAGNPIATDDDSEEDFDEVIENLVLPASPGFVYYLEVTSATQPGLYDLFFRIDNVPFTMTPNVGPKVAVGSEVRAAFTASNPSVARTLNFRVERVVNGVTTNEITRNGLPIPAAFTRSKPNVFIGFVPNEAPGTVIRYRAVGTVNGRPVIQDFDVVVE